MSASISFAEGQVWRTQANPRDIILIQRMQALGRDRDLKMEVSRQSLKNPDHFGDRNLGFAWNITPAELTALLIGFERAEELDVGA